MICLHKGQQLSRLSCWLLTPLCKDRHHNELMSVNFTSVSEHFTLLRITNIKTKQNQITDRHDRKRQCCMILLIPARFKTDLLLQTLLTYQHILRPCTAAYFRPLPCNLRCRIRSSSRCKQISKEVHGRKQGRIACPHPRLPPPVVLCSQIRQPACRQQASTNQHMNHS